MLCINYCQTCLSDLPEIHIISIIAFDVSDEDAELFLQWVLKNPTLMLLRLEWFPEHLATKYRSMFAETRPSLEFITG